MQPTLALFSFPYAGPWRKEMTNSHIDLAQDIAKEEGILWKLWLENEEEQTAGGVYLFEDSQSADQYCDKHKQRMLAMGYRDIEIRTFSINVSLSRITNADPEMLKRITPVFA
ncbi:monooxygenase [Sneathiella chungangensis]|uniref:Monooxygenase n=2 Tax=Sneathiella chungangensis TaxID=1418234 RepID=A0A845MGJ5_9PROT|nr:monooxygenase [Sneathiella chungangensis]MZR22752.1 monooxygenase [Sneathiella chungangensis]